MTSTESAPRSLPEIGRLAKAATRQIARAATTRKDAALAALADGLDRARAAILAANADDVAAARAAGREPWLVDRLMSID